MTFSAVALPPVLPSELLTYILSLPAYPITLIICQPRASFFQFLLQSVPQYMPRHVAQDQEPIDDTLERSEETPTCHPLLVPTLQQVAASRYINLVFTPTLSHLRAYLGVFPPKRNDKASKPPPEQVIEDLGRKPPLLVVYGMVGIHRDTSEWSAQGLGSSFASLVEAGWRSRREIVLLEETKLDEDPEDVPGDELFEEWEERKKVEVLKVWEEKVPMLNRSVRRAGFESEEGGWSGRTVEVGRILSRWFKFGNRV